MLSPRAGLVSGCYPQYPHYKDMPERVQLVPAKRRARVQGRFVNNADWLDGLTLSAHFLERHVDIAIDVEIQGDAPLALARRGPHLLDAFYIE